jgi:xanthine phosphoribosyltransferase
MAQRSSKVDAEKLFYRWPDIDTLIEVIVKERLPKTRKFDTVVGIPRGGLIPASILAYRLDIHKVYSSLGIQSESNKILLVDDICDSGATLKDLRQRFPNATYCTLIERNNGRIIRKVDNQYSGGFVRPGLWIQFPWAPYDFAKPGRTPI